MERIIRLKERRINVVLKSDTKKELDKLSSSRRDSYDDIIRRLINEHYQQFHHQVAEDINKNVNKISSYKKPRRKESTIIIDKTQIEYSFNVPSKEGLTNYTFDIHYTKASKTNKLTPQNNILTYAKIIEKIIQTYINPIFRLEKINFEKYNKETYKNILNLAWWERKFKNSGLSYETFKRDIKEKFIELGAI